VSEKIIVLKFGSSVLRTSEDLPNAVHEIYRWVRSGLRVIAVVSAIGDATDRLLANARALSPAPEPFATAELLATGERASAALIGVALDQAGVVARVLNPREIGLTVAGSPLASPYATNKGSAMLKADFVPGFPLRHAAKDASLAADAAYNHGLELPLTAALLGRWHQAMALGHGEDDVASAITVSTVTSGQQAYI